MPLGEAGDSQWEFVPGVCASLAASSLSLRLWILPHNPPALLMPESVDKKLLSCSLPPVLKCKFEPLGRQEAFELQARSGRPNRVRILASRRDRGAILGDRRSGEVQCVREGLCSQPSSSCGCAGIVGSRCQEKSLKHSRKPVINEIQKFLWSFSILWCWDITTPSRRAPRQGPKTVALILVKRDIKGHRVPPSPVLYVEF